MDDDGGDSGFEPRDGAFVNCRSSEIYLPPQSEKVGGITMSSMSVCKEVSSSKANPCSSASIAEPVLVSDWNPLVSMAQHVDFNGFTALSSYNVGVLENPGINSSSAGFVEQIPRLPCFNSGNFSEIISSFALPEDGRNAGGLCPTDFPSSDENGVAKDSKGKKRKKMPECCAFDSHSPFNRIQTTELKENKDVSPEKDEKKQKGEQNPGSGTRKPTSKHAKENSSNSDVPKEDYIHVRAKRGQATNSHSLAERVRREKISERMRLLQDLVPGCNKITGKAVMLDEIINYVQSLQQQVEFLSMKLATVNPEVNFDIEQILSKDILHLRNGSSTMLGFGPGISSSHPHLHGSTPQGVMQAEMAIHGISNSGEVLKTTLSQISSMAQISNVWDNELHKVMHMGLIPNARIDASTEAPGSMKMER